MATEKQIEANRRNAQKSTGPKTAEGKAASRFNALNHGLRAERLALPHEDLDEVQAFVDAIVEAIGPSDAVEAELACEVATLSWKLRRAERYEHAVLSKRLHAMIDDLVVTDSDEETTWNIEIAAFDDDEAGRRRRRYIQGIRNSLARARKELRAWQESHPEPQPEEPSEIGFVRQEPILECGSEAADLPEAESDDPERLEHEPEVRPSVESHRTEAGVSLPHSRGDVLQPA